MIEAEAMEHEGLIAALAANWNDGGTGVAHDRGPVTLKNLAASLNAWIDGQPVPNLGQRLEQMRVRVLDAARATEKDLSGTLADDLRGPLQASLDTYEQVESLLDALAQSHERGNRAIKNLVAGLDAARTRLLECDQAMQEWLRAPILRCPRCGTQPQGRLGYRCPHCQVDMLYPDPESALDDSQTSAHLGPEYMAVFEALSLVVQGEAPLSRLLGALGPLETMLGNWARIAEAEDSSNAQLTYALDTVADAARRSLAGTEQMRAVVETRQTRDLNEGWRVLFEAAQELQGAIPTIARGVGSSQRGGFTGGNVLDSITLDGFDD